ncbi:hypothetical protein BOTBODRAFT_52326 [Botryobasidium botryosum FD-172 SS1]|uniref:VPS9 domain-containing protein n=1 Tax=Botryobasidium botryosum (strain FD-172 SS1) TaxID=930990 RepID=A0A067MWT3_BOTB1|nr:hypothetical protein BOTBODRAFT_52326 [Botryobasidium botryosum FD-172 SS1]
MTSRRDGEPFPSTSLSRAGGSRLRASNDPLLSAGSPRSSLDSATGPGELRAMAPSPSLGTSPPRYVPYTPRHRLPSSTTTTSANPSIAMSSPQVPGGATEKLQLQNMKAAAQAIGLTGETLGWAILEMLTVGGEGAEWKEVETLVHKDKMVLLLPTEPVSSNLNITPDIVKEHMAFVNVPSSTPAQLVTLSGLRGSINGETLTFRSNISQLPKVFTALQSPSTRAAALASLPPLPSTLTPSPTPPYPSFALPAYAATLPLIPRASPVPIPPPLPPRPALAGPAAVATSRLVNPFASLFGKAQAPSRSSTPPPPAPLPAVATSPSMHEMPLSGDQSPLNDPQPGEGPTIAAYAIDRRIIREEISKGVAKAIKGELKEALQGLPSWVPDRVLGFAGPLHPFPKPPKAKPKLTKKGSTSDAGGSPLSGKGARLNVSSTAYQGPTADLTNAQTATKSFQAFYESLEEDLSAYWSIGGSPMRLGKKRDDEKGGDSGTYKLGGEGREMRVRMAMEQVEKCLCCLFYDRIFRPPGSDDESHDEALASRVAALNMLDLNLQHLGVDVGADSEARLNEVVADCGKKLELLEDSSNRSPQQKAAILVEAHKVVVDGLSRIRVEVKSEDAITGEKLPQSSSSAQDDELPDATSADEVQNVPMVTEPAQIFSSPPSLSPQPLGHQLVDASESPLHSPIIHREELSASPVPSRPRSSTPLPISVPPAADILSAPSSPPPTHSISSDLLLPVIIFSVVKANPTRLVSHLLYVQRYRSKQVGGEENFCLVNLMAVVEFLENVDLEALGLSSSDKVLSAGDLSPIPLSRDGLDMSTSPLTTTARLRGRVEQQVGELAGSANKVIIGVVDSSFTALRGLLSPSLPEASIEEGEESIMRSAPGFGLLRRAGSGFSIANVTASLPGASAKKRDADEGQQMVEVMSRPGSIKELEEHSEDVSESGETDSSDDEGSEGDSDAKDKSDVRSIKSFNSMMSGQGERMTISDRLASVSGLSRFAKGLPSEGLKPSPSESRRASLLLSPPAPPSNPLPDVTPPPLLRIPPPNPRFMECSVADLRMGEIGELMREYRRVVEGLRALGGFEPEPATAS